FISLEMNSSFTFIFIDGYVGLNKYKYLFFLIMLTVYILIILSNCVIVYLIWTHQNLHGPMYIFIAALSLNSLLFSTNIYPKLLIDSLSDRPIISYQACLVQYFLFYALGSADFLLLAAMAYDRYVSICKPLWYGSIMTSRAVISLLFLSWFVSASQIAVTAIVSADQKLCHFTLRGIFCHNSFFRLHCRTSRIVTVNGLLALVLLALLPMLFILFTYMRILLVSYRSSREVRKKAAETCFPHLLVLLSFSTLAAFNIITPRLEHSLSRTVHLVMTLQVILYNPLLNPIIYGLKMKEISKHLNKLLCNSKKR
ncbi:olfactory receptor 11A1-like, partial [Salarias fasciatus]|uniref:olfactory receptor 11A1-like n=1 Tax=Salarias fasciatus TaxID=181472 RepID=UPI001176BDF4